MVIISTEQEEGTSLINLRQNENIAAGKKPTSIHTIVATDNSVPAREMLSHTD